MPKGTKLQRLLRAVESLGVTPPVFVAPGSVCFVTMHAVCRMHRFAPQRRVVRMLDYCLRLAAQKYEGQIRLHEFLFMSNHAHLLLTDVAGVLPSFMQWLDSLLSRNLNAMRGETGRNFDGYSAQIIEADDRDRQLRAAVYILNNPCAANLVTRSRHWKATSSLGLRYGVASTAKRPAEGLYKGTLGHLHGRRSTRSGRARYARTKSTPVAELTLHRLPGFIEEHVSNVQLRKQVLERLDVVENKLVVQRRRQGASVLGWRRVIATAYNAVPRSSRELFDTRPTVAASTSAFRARAQKRIRKFRCAYYIALERFKSGAHDVVFPHGTWLMARLFNCPRHSAAP